MTNLYAISDYIISSGIPRETLLFILSLPIVATLATISRNVIGVKGFRIFIPIIVTYAFVALGAKYALPATAIVIVMSLLVRWLMRKSRLQYSSRMALLITLCGLAILGGLFAAKKLGIESAASVPFFPILLLIAMGEEFVDVLLKQGPRSATILYIETILLAIIGYFMMTWEAYQTFILNWPIVIVVAIILVILIGRWTGLRLTEMFKFRDVAKAEADKESEESK